MDPPSSPDRVDPLATPVVPSPVAAISSLGHASAPANALTGTAAGGPLNGFAASSSPFQSAAPKEILPYSRVGDSALPVPGAPHPPAITVSSAANATATSSVPFPTDDALGHLSGSAMPGFPVLQSSTPHQPVGADPTHSEFDPHLLLGYDPLATVGEMGVIACYKLGRSCNKQINTVLKRVVDLERDFKVRLNIAYIETDSNPADGPSRGVLPTGPRLSNFKISPPLAPYLHAVPLD
ncbi:hypothetical protein CF319_g7209 [Tilletia indica]|nr:hypothetical protein CF319_g7209 [Tilletia indica]